MACFTLGILLTFTAGVTFLYQPAIPGTKPGLVHVAENGFLSYPSSAINATVYSKQDGIGNVTEFPENLIQDDPNVYEFGSRVSNWTVLGSNGTLPDREFCEWKESDELQEMCGLDLEYCTETEKAHVPVSQAITFDHFGVELRCVLSLASCSSEAPPTPTVNVEEQLVETVPHAPSPPPMISIHHPVYSCRDEYIPLPGSDSGWLAIHETFRAQARNWVFATLPEPWSEWICTNRPMLGIVMTSIIFTSMIVPLLFLLGQTCRSNRKKSLSVLYEIGRRRILEETVLQLQGEKERQLSKANKELEEQKCLYKGTVKDLVVALRHNNELSANVKQLEAQGMDLQSQKNVLKAELGAALHQVAALQQRLAEMERALVAPRSAVPLVVPMPQQIPHGPSLSLTLLPQAHPGPQHQTLQPQAEVMKSQTRRRRPRQWYNPPRMRVSRQATGPSDMLPQ